MAGLLDLIQNTSLSNSDGFTVKNRFGQSVSPLEAFTGAMGGLGNILSGAARGSITSALGGLGDINQAIVNNVGSLLPNAPALPTTAQWQQLLPGQPTSPEGQIAQKMGEFMPLTPSAAGKLVTAGKDMPVGMMIVNETHPTWDKLMGDAAKMMEADGKTAEEIHKVTGTYRNAAGDWEQAHTHTYPQEKAMKAAQEHAALPVEQGGLGLGPNNTAAERAAAMGFDIESLHGTSNPNIQKFDPSLVGTKAGNAFDNYMWSTTNPDAATGYSLNMESYKSLPEVISLKDQKNDILKQIANAFQEKDTKKVDELRKQLNSIQDKETAIFDTFKKGQILSEGSTVYPLVLQRQEFMPYEAGGKSWMKANRPAIEQSQDLGYQGVQINNVIDNPNSFMGNTPATTFATENPDLIRSRFAAFDPWRRTAAIAAMMGMAAPDLLAKERK